MEPIITGAEQLNWQQTKNLARLCAGCGKCKQACARKLSTADLLADVRAKHPHWSQHLWQLWIRKMGFMWPTLGRVASTIPCGITPAAFAASLATAKAMVDNTPSVTWATIAKSNGVSINTSPVAVFAGCTANNIRPHWGKKAEQLLAAWGYPIASAAGFTCCGGTLHHAGQYGAMDDVRKQNVAYWIHLNKPRIAAFCASCFHGLQEYPESLFTHDDAALWKSSVMPLTALLTGAIVNRTTHAPATYGYHQPCHWGIADTDMPFLRSIVPGLTKGTGLCCGMGGILKMTNPTLSANMAETCLTGFAQNITEIITGCSGCTMQLTASAPHNVHVRHWLDVIAPA